jgi:class 3 adenylate cyclase
VDRRLAIRVGLNAGEVLREEIGSGSGYFGTPVVVARRLCDRAEAGQILCTQTVAGILAGRAAFGFRDLGTLELKEISGTSPPARFSTKSTARRHFSRGRPSWAAPKSWRSWRASSSARRRGRADSQAAAVSGGERSLRGS